MRDDMKGTVHVRDVAAYVLRERGGMSTFKLQKLCYYSQAWHYTLFGKKLFPQRIEAWVNGPVSPVLYQHHRGRYFIDVDDLRGDPGALSESQRSVVDQVLAIYGPLSPVELVDRTHVEDPWRDARDGLPPRERGDSEITVEAMARYYSRLLPASG